MIHQIVVVGGGSAGWLTAALIAAEYVNSDNPDFKVTLVESPNVATIGVGEGTWPTMRSSLQKLGISEALFLKECHASFKQGSKFLGWRTGDQDDAYHHPFTLPAGYLESNIVGAWQREFAGCPFAQVASVQPAIIDAGLAPKQKTTPEFSGLLNYGYHLDAGAFVALLQQHATQKLGVRHLVDHVDSVSLAADGAIAKLYLRDAGIIEGDLYVDCTGSACLLLGEALKVPFVDLTQFSINDTALALQVPYPHQETAIASCTLATAQSAGWIWDIGLTHRRGVGYVYSSAHIGEDLAVEQLHRYLAPLADDNAIRAASIKKIRIRAGHREVFWRHNCVAVGMAAGFIEPLEASALALVELSVNAICEELTCSKQAMPIIAQRFNQLFSYRWQRIVDFLKLHYLLSERCDSDYWRDVKQASSISVELQEQLQLWQYRAPSLGDLTHSAEIFPSASYLYVLAGMGFFDKKPFVPRASDRNDKALMQINETLSKIEQYRAHLPTNRALLSHVRNYGMCKI